MICKPDETIDLVRLNNAIDQDASGAGKSKKSLKGFFKAIYSICYYTGILTAKSAKFLCNLIAKVLFKFVAFFSFLFICIINRNKFKKTKYRPLYTVLNFGLPALALAGLLATVFFWTGASFGLEVTYNGQTLGYINNEEVFTQAADLINSKLLVKDGVNHIDTPTFELKLVNAANIMDKQALSEVIVENTSGIITASGLFVNEELFAAAENDEVLTDSLSACLDYYKTDEEAERVAFVDDVNIAEGLFPVSVVESAEEVKTILWGESGSAETREPALDVKIIRDITYEEVVPYDTQEIPDDTRLEDYTKIKSKGVNGVASVTAQVTYVDGEEVDRHVISSEVIEQPVSCQLIVGKMTVSQYNDSKAFSAPAENNTKNKMFWPVARVSRSYVSSYYGDNRDHKGMDIAAPTGTDIYAAEAGTVVSMNESGAAYGNHFIIDHGNGVKTLYGHCSAIFVKVGQKVERGEKIAAVGSTGRSTGPHLHFEVRINNVIVNPYPYV